MREHLLAETLDPTHQGLRTCDQLGPLSPTELLPAEGVLEKLSPHAPAQGG